MQFSIGKVVKPLYVQVLIGVALGVAFGAIEPALGTDMKVLGDAFIKLVKMLVAPIVFATVVTGIAKMGDIKAVGRVGLKALIYFEVVTTGALAIGLIVGHVMNPGGGMNVDPKTLNLSSVAGYAKVAQEQSIKDFFMHIIPESFVGAFVHGDILPVVFIAVLFGLALAHAGERSATLVKIVDEFLHTMFGVVTFVMKFAPIGAFGAIAFTVGKYGLTSLLALGQLMMAFYVTCIVFVLVVLGGVLKLCGINIFRFIAYLKTEILITLGTSSAEPALPRLLEKLERMGCEKSVVGLVVPTGYAFNLDGVCIYLTMAVVFIAQATNTHLTLGQELVILAMGLVTSKGMSGVPGGGFVALAATLSAVHVLPLSAIALLVGIDRFMGEARSVTSIIGNAVAAVVIAKWEKAFDPQKMREALFHQSDVEEELSDADAPKSVPAAVTEVHRPAGS
ncbi:C4-dicarboxylate transporter DctA [Paraburkholderia sabiae]|uniref:C4-dicarboxylate transporter DctA n=1 Tax=Paraburkholderia sabiae TaxID=273251 RepID=A0ABU9QL91_9BURK|nr:C4-dicarboxylate transporter DctA [Paraburkholderia sabiae]CAD6560834.1 Aerobic C4-dicarboxylate transport protein [Paraburkholderia sabiae]